MGILQTFASSALSLQNKRPQTFGVDPAPPDSLHLNYSTTGTPVVRWRSINSVGMTPRPSQLDDLKSKYTPNQGSYINNKPL